MVRIATQPVLPPPKPYGRLPELLGKTARFAELPYVRSKATEVHGTAWSTTPCG